MGILKSYDLKINGMGRVVYLKKTQHDSLYLGKTSIPFDDGSATVQWVDRNFCFNFNFLQLWYPATINKAERGNPRSKNSLG